MAKFVLIGSCYYNLNSIVYAHRDTRPGTTEGMVTVRFAGLPDAETLTGNSAQALWDVPQLQK